MQRYLSLLALAGTFTISLGAAELPSETVQFRSGDETVSAHVVWPETDEAAPAIILIHEWWGVTPWLKEQAQRLAARGYVVLCADLYRGQVTDQAAQARKLKDSLPEDRALQDLAAARAWLKGQKRVAGDRLGTLGWCMGGAYAMKFALASELQATVVCYGHVPTDAETLKANRGPVLGIFGTADSSIPEKSVKAFEAGLREAGVDQRVLLYEGGQHAFMNSHNPERHHPEATKKAWAEIEKFFAAKLKE